MHLCTRKLRVSRAYLYAARSLSYALKHILICFTKSQLLFDVHHFILRISDTASLNYVFEQSSLQIAHVAQSNANKINMHTITPFVALC